LAKLEGAWIIGFQILRFGFGGKNQAEREVGKEEGKIPNRKRELLEDYASV